MTEVEHHVASEQVESADNGIRVTVSCVCGASFSSQRVLSGDTEADTVAASDAAYAELARHLGVDPDELDEQPQE